MFIQLTSHAGNRGSNPRSSQARLSLSCIGRVNTVRHVHMENVQRFYEWDRIFFTFSQVRSTIENILKPCLTSKKNSIFKVKNHWIFCLLHFLFKNCTTRIIWRDVTIACYFHTVKVTLLIFSQCEIYRYYSMNISVYHGWCVRHGFSEMTSRWGEKHRIPITELTILLHAS